MSTIKCHGNFGPQIYLINLRLLNSNVSCRLAELTKGPVVLYVPHFYVAYTKFTVDSFLAKPVNLPSKQVRPEIVTMFAIVFLAAVKVNDNSKASKKRIVDNLEYFH